MFSGTGSFTFPLGDNTGTAEYSPATLNFTGGTFSSAWAGVKVTPEKQGNIPADDTSYLNRYWTVTQSGITGFTCETAFNYVPADVTGTETTIYGAQWDGTEWTVFDPVNAATHSFEATVSSFSDFTGVERPAPETQATNLGFSSITQTQMTVKWTRGDGDKILIVAHQGSAVDSPPVDGTDYTASAAFGSGTQIGTGNYVVYKGTGNSVTVTGLSAQTAYHFRAYEYNESGSGPAYNTDAATGNPSSQTTLPNPPGAPLAKGATSVTETGFQANWNTTTGADSYRLDVSTQSDFSTYVTGYQSKNVGNTTSTSVTGLSGGTPYYYRLRAVNGGGTSGNSNSISVTTLPPAPVATAATSVTQTGFQANWNAAAGADGYRLDVSTRSDFSSYVTGYQDRDVGNTTNASVTGLSGGTPYYYRLRAFNGGGTSGNSNTITVGTEELPTRVGLTGPAVVNAGAVTTAFTLSSLDENGDPAPVNADTVFNLSSSSSGAPRFFSDAGGRQEISRVTILNGGGTAVFYYMDTVAGTPTITAARTSGMDLGSAGHQITVEAGTVSGTVFDDLNGNGVQDADEPGIGGVTVTLLDGEGITVQTERTDGSGNYRFSSVSSGNYTVLETDPEGYTSTTGNRVPVYVSPGGSAGVNFGDQQQSIVSGTVFDDYNGDGFQNINEPGLSNVTVTLLDGGGIAVQTERTDGSGNYRFSSVSSGNYTVLETDPEGYTSTTSNRVPVYVSPGGSAGVNFGDEIEGTVSGHVFLDSNGNGIQDADEPGIGGVTVKLTDKRRAARQTAKTDGEGIYQFSGVSNGNYTVEETDPSGYISTTSNTVPILVTGLGGSTANFGDQKTGTLSGKVFEDTNGNGAPNHFERGIGGVAVTLYQNGAAVSATTTTGDGGYQFDGLTSGTYSVEETDPEGYGSTSANTVTVNVGDGNAGANFGDLPLGTISGVVFNDTNGNGVQDPGETGVKGVTVNLLDGQEVLVASMVTTGNGIFLFQNLQAGTYTVEEIFPEGYTGTTTSRVTVTVGALTANATGNRNRDVPAANFGVLQQKTVSGIVFNDTNGNGVQDAGENGVGGVMVRLFDEQAAVVSENNTAGNGSYGFYNLTPADYTVQETYPEGYTGSTPQSVAVTVAEGGAATANFGIFQGEAPSHVGLTGPGTVLTHEVSTAFTLTSKDAAGNTSNVTADSIFSLSSNTHGKATFYSDAAGSTVVTSVTILNGTSQAVFYYSDTKSGSPVVTAAWQSGGTDLERASHTLNVIADYAGYAYVSKDGLCGGMTPCYATIQEAVDATPTDHAIRIGKGTYEETVTLNAEKDLTLQGGWDESYATQTMNTTFMNPPRILQGSLTLQMITLKTDFLYVSKDGLCGGMTPCYATIQEAVDAAQTDSIVRVGQGTFTGDITLNEAKTVILRGGWDTLFTTQTAGTTFITSPKVIQGAIKMEMVGIKPAP